MGSIERESTSVEDEAMRNANVILTIDPSLYVHMKDATSTRNLQLELKQIFDVINMKFNYNSSFKLAVNDAFHYRSY